jgi:predicted ATPase
MTERAPPEELRLTVQNFRGVRRASWAPSGVCALVGPNASGKSTLLEAFQFVRNAVLRSPKDAILISGGMQAFISHDPVLDAPGDDPALARVRFTVEAPEGSWTLSFSATNDNVAPVYDESLRLEGMSDDESLPPRDIGQPPFLVQGRWTRPTSSGLLPPLAFNPDASRFRDHLDRISLYRPWELQRLRAHPFSDPSLDDVILAPDGANVFVVLQNWRDAREHAWRFDWVLDKLRRIHPQRVSGLELKKGAGVLGAQLYAPGDEAPLPIKSASHGILGTLLSLTAAAGGRDGGLVLIDEPDNGLHPSAIRALVDAFRELNEKEGTNIALATHSPVILNAFSETPEDVWVTEQKSGTTFPARLTELCEPEWLANFRLGNIYGAGFGRQDPLSGSEG